MENSTSGSEIVWSDRKHFMWFPFSFTKYEIRKERLYTQRGLFHTVFDELLLYRVIDITLRRSFRQKIFGTGTLILTTKADKDHQLILENIKRPYEIKDMLSDMVENIRDKKRVVGKEFYTGPGKGHPDMDFDPEMDDMD